MTQFKCKIQSETLPLLDFYNPSIPLMSENRKNTGVISYFFVSITDNILKLEAEKVKCTD